MMLKLKQITSKDKRTMVGCVLKKFVEEREDHRKIGLWAFNICNYFERNSSFYKILSKMAYEEEDDFDREFITGKNNSFQIIPYEEMGRLANEIILSEASIPDGYAPASGYNEVNFGAELKRRVFRKDSIESLAKWALEIFIEMDYGTLDGIRDEDLKNALLNLAAMAEGPKYDMSYEELDKLADDMILGRKIELK